VNDDPEAAAGFAGDPVRSAARGGLRLHVSRFRAGERVATHGHDEPYVCLALGGPFRERVGSRTWTEGPLTLIRHPAGEEHDDLFEGDAVCVYLSYSRARIDDRGPETRLWRERQACTRGPVLALGLRLLQLHAAAPEGASTLDWDELAAEFVAADAPPPVPPARLARVLEAIEDDPTHTPSLTDVGRLVQLHPIYVARAFRRAYGMSIGESLRQARVRRALRLLTTTDAPLSDVAPDAGFVDQSHMTRLVKRFTGVTPAALRRHVRGVRPRPDARFGASKTRRG
jgi:AraC family transcriptional regulator